MKENAALTFRTVLMIEDSPEDRESYRRYLARARDYQYKLLEAESLADGLTQWRTHRPDCVLLDYQLPDGNGLTALQTIIAEGGPDACAIVLLTGGENLQLAVETLKEGAHDYLNKNRVTPESLQHAVNTAIEKATLRRQLDEQREWLRVTLASIGDAVMATDPDGRITFLNEVAQQLTGWTQAEAAGHPITEVFNIVNETTRLTVESPVTRTLREGIIVGLANHTILLTKDGREVPIDDSAAPIRNEAGKVSGAVLVFRDITERRKAEDLLQQSEERLKLGVEVANFAIAEIDYTTGLNHLSPAAAQLFGLGEAAMSLPREVVHATFHPDDAEELHALIAASLDPNGDGWLAREHRIILPNGEVRWLNVRKQIFFDRASLPPRPVRGILAAHDITKRKQAEEMLRESNEELARFNRLAVDRELRMIELKKEINALCSQVGQPPRYDLAFEEEQL